MWEGLVLLYRNLVSNQASKKKIEYVGKMQISSDWALKSLQLFHLLEKFFVLNFNVQPNCSKENTFTSQQ